MKVVIADDSRVMRQIVLRTLRQAGFADHEYVEAADGADALAKIREHDPAVVLSDWNMPNKTGIELLRQLRAQGNGVPFGFVTSEGSQEMRDVAVQAGAMFVIAKPFTAEAFEDALAPVLG
jgi:two-component system chemotaxis response regulator CheY